MLSHLRVKNLAVIEDVTVDFGPGLNILTGETGAGKSIVVDALALLSGVRAATHLIRKETDRLAVSGVFRPPGQEWRDVLSEAGLTVEEDEIVVRREVTRDGPNRVFLNDEPVTLKLLADVSPHLLRIHAQREELNLVSPEFQRRLLDRSGGKKGRKILQETAAAYARFRQLDDRWQRLVGDEKARLERLDLLRFQRREIDAAAVVAGEEEALRTEREILRHSETIRAALGESVLRLMEEDGSAVERLASSERALDAVAEWEPHAAAWAKDVEDLRIRLEEVSRDLGQRLRQIDSEPGRLDAIEERLAMLERLFRKYGDDSVAVLEYRAQLGEELDELTMDDESRSELEQEVAASLEEYRLLSLELSAERRRWSSALAAGVKRELADLAMGRAEFSVALSRKPRAHSPLEIDGLAVDFGPGGIDEVSFELAANPGEASGPLSAVASGGELSRVYLALRLAVGAGGGDSLSSLVFDEIDSGVGGAEAAALGKKLRRLAGGAQVFAVTHLPQVASHGHHHYRVRKSVHGGRTRISVDFLEPEERVEEIARMLAGKKVTDLSLSHAEELMAGVD